MSKSEAYWADTGIGICNCTGNSIISIALQGLEIQENGRQQADQKKCMTL